MVARSPSQIDSRPRAPTMAVVRVDESVVEEEPTRIVRLRVDAAPGFELLAHESSGFFNATALCERSGKTYAAYDRVARFCGADRWLRAKVGAPLSFDAEPESAVAGTYVHLFKLLHLASWLSEELFVDCAAAANAFFASRRRRPIGDEEARDGGGVVDEEANGGACALVADDRGWLSAHGLCGGADRYATCLLYTSPSPRDRTRSRMPSSA